MRRISACFLFLLFSASLFAQPGIGQWREHLSYKNATDLIKKGDNIIVASGEALFIFNTKDKELNRFSTLDGLSEAGISTIEYHEGLDIIIVAYTSGNIDLIQDGDIFNLADIKRSTNILGNKGINHILIHGDYAFLSCGFGMVKLNLKLKEFTETYFIGDQATNLNLFQSAIFKDTIYTTTASGVYKAGVNDPSIIDYNSWTKIDLMVPTDSGIINLRDSLINTLAANDNYLIFNHRSSIFNNDSQYSFDGQEIKKITTSSPFRPNNINLVNDHFLINGDNWVQHYNEQLNLVFSFDNSELNLTCSIVDEEGNYWGSDTDAGLILWTQFLQNFKPEGPNTNKLSRLSFADGTVFMAHGGRSTGFKPQLRGDLGSVFRNESWTTLTNNDFTIFDIETLTQDPAHENVIWGATWFRGIVKFEDHVAIEHLTPLNSEIPKRTNDSGPETAWIAGLEFDKEGTMWILSSQSSFPLTTLDQSGNWDHISFGAIVSNITHTKELMITSRDQKWFTLKDGGVIVYDENSEGSKFKKLSTNSGSGNLKTNNILCMAEDKTGKIWMGTSEGLSIIHNPRNIFTGGNYDADRVLIFFDGNWEELFSGQQINDIAVDGGNRKWFATNNGVYLTSADGVEQLHHFTSENSVLLSNSVLDITINQETGEVFFGTEQGLISLMADAVDAELDGSDVKIFPNPVHPDFQGEVSIDGLLENSAVKITDISGNIVYETRSRGGRATWDGRTLDGDKVKSGVYIVLSADDEATLSEVGRFLIIR